MEGVLQMALSEKVESFLEKKVLVIGDVHNGIRSNSPKWHESLINYANWLKAKAESLGVKTIIQLGDVFHNREEIELTTLQNAQKFFEILSDFNLIVIVGNHDCYYKENATIHSLSPFKGWKNICIIDEPVVIDHSKLKRKMAFIPWGTDIDTLPDGMDYLFGHLEINNFGHTLFKICTTGLSGEKLVKKAKQVFSGHFHCRAERGYEGDKRIIMVGNIYQQDWGDYELTKGIYLLDFENMGYEFILNDISPYYMKITPNDFEETLPKCKGNMVKLVIPPDFDTATTELMVSKISDIGVMEVRVEIDGKSAGIMSADGIDSVAIDMKQMFVEFVTQLENVDNKDKILEELLGLYEKAVNQLKSE